MTLFLVCGPLFFLFLLASTVFKDAGIDSLKTGLRGLAASTLPLLAHFLTRTLVPLYPGSFASIFHYWFYDYFWFLAAGAGLFFLDARSSGEETGRKRRLICFMTGTLIPSGLATILFRGAIPDAWILLAMPASRIALLLLVAHFVDAAASDGYGWPFRLDIAAAVALPFAVSAIAVFHYWNRWYFSVPLYLALLALTWWTFRHDFRRGVSEELRHIRQRKAVTREQREA